VRETEKESLKGKRHEAMRNEAMRNEAMRLDKRLGEERSSISLPCRGRKDQ
jgi:hypothetical protein